MKKILIIIILFSLVVGCSNKINSKSEGINNMKVIIDNKEYVLELEDNDTVKEFIKTVPKEYEMIELNDNEKYVNLDKSLPTNSIYPKTINQGDVMLFGDDCLVIFYKSFETTYSYTKIGHINNLPNLGNKNIKVRITK